MQQQLLSERNLPVRPDAQATAVLVHLWQQAEHTVAVQRQVREVARQKQAIKQQTERVQYAYD